MKALVTAFDAFGGDSSNASHEAVSRLPARIGGMIVTTALLPTSFSRAIPVLRAAIAREAPEIVLCVGLAADRNAINIERVAVNLDDARLPDNDGAQPADRPVVRGGPAAYFSTLPVRKIVTRLTAEKIPCELSMSAGTFVCNHVFYALMHLAAQRKQRFRSGFVHVPDLPRTAKHGAMPLEQMVRGLSLVLEVVRRGA
jgi:pyroglutamyl-peptidase